MKKSAQKGNTFLIILICSAFIIGAAIFLTNGSQKSKPSTLPSPTSTTTKFQSSNVMKFSIDVPKGFTIQDNNGFVLIISRGNQILISKNGTNFNDIRDFLQTLQTQDGFHLASEAKLSVEGAQAVSGMVGNEKNYYIMPKGAYRVYILSTKSPQLYSALDQIAKSFRYTP